MWRGGLRFSLLLPPLSFGGTSIAEPSLRFHILLIEPDKQFSRIRLSDKTHTFAHETSSAVHPAYNTGPCSLRVHRPSILRTTANATTWVVVRSPDHKSKFFLRFSMWCLPQRSHITGVA